MTLRAWRIIKNRHAASAFRGDGARLAGGRWNSPGVSMVYTAGNPALAMLEMLVHLQAQELLNHYVLFEVSFDERLVTKLAVKDLPKTWRKSPPSTTIQRIGDTWIADRKSAVLRVPSAVLPIEWNYLLNPAHPDFKRITTGPKRPVQFDPRLVKMMSK